MAAHADPLQLPSRGTQAYDELKRTLRQACTRGDLATLQHAGAAALFHVNVYPLQPALRSRQPHVVAWLVEEGERTGFNIADDWKAMHLAAYCGDMDALKAASDKELALLAWDDKTGLHAAAAGDQAGAIEYLVRERGVDVHAVDDVGETALHTASELGCVSAIEALVVVGARLHDEPGRPCKALKVAAENGQVAAMQKLVELGADVGLVGRYGGVVHAAARGGSVEGIDAAVRLGADPRAVDGDGRTALHKAASRNKPGVMGRLVQLGTQLENVDDHGQTALHIASSHCLLDACRTLLELGADRWIKDDEGETARDMAGRDHYGTKQPQQVVEVLDSYFPIVPSMAQLLLGLRGPSESSLTRFAAHSAFEPKVLSLVNCLLVGKDDKAFGQLVEEGGGFR